MTPTTVYFKLLKEGPADGPTLDDRINVWLDSAGVNCIGSPSLLELRDGTLAVLIPYQPVPAPDIHPAAANIPVIRSSRTRRGARERVEAMAGVFCVPHGEKFSEDDSEPAPSPLVDPAALQARTLR